MCRYIVILFVNDQITPSVTYRLLTCVVEVVKASGATIVGEPLPGSARVTELRVRCVLVSRWQIVAVFGAPCQIDGFLYLICAASNVMYTQLFQTDYL